MQLCHSRGVTLVQTMVAMSILLVLTGMLAVAIGPAIRESGRQDQCKRKLASIFKAAVLYSEEYDMFDELKGMGPIGVTAMGKPQVLLPYLGKTKESFMCPDTPDCAKKTLFSSYQWTFVGFSTATEEAGPSTFSSQIRERLAREGDKLPIVRCGVHDEVYYQPKEPGLDPRLAKPFLIELTLGGSIRTGRFSAPRSNLIKRECANGEARR